MAEKIRVIACIVIGVIVSLFATTGIMNAKQAEAQEALAKETFRFHVLANSDSEEDQTTKMKVKEAVISYMKEKLPDASNAAETKEWAETNIKELETIAQTVLCEEGVSDSITVKVTNCYFPEKAYGDVIFPAGDYEALRIEIGDAKGQNWWCVLYPNLCFVDAIHAVVPDEGKEELKEVLEVDAYEMVTSKTRFHLKWFFF